VERFDTPASCFLVLLLAAALVAAALVAAALVATVVTATEDQALHTLVAHAPNLLSG